MKNIFAIVKNSTKISSACSLFRFIDFNRQIKIWEIFQNTPTLKRPFDEKLRYCANQNGSFWTTIQKILKEGIYLYLGRVSS